MTIELANFLMKAAKNAGHDARLCNDYSGRGMCGETTVGIVVDSVPQLLADGIQYVSEQICDFCDDNTSLKEWTGGTIPDVTQFRTDNMGHQIIIY